ncbi:unnamed protein product [Euphydryas editha]|uniref:Reverse transcriptase n=1 Tax=Euphydryas editha TaxID=104508 RepID=A0AAU9UCX9_EUPED|nr:unnamed protein product [Euphydryas editha]
MQISKVVSANLKESDIHHCTRVAKLNSVYYQNVRELRTKTHNFLCNISCTNYDILVLTETWLNDKINDEELFDNRYTVYRRDRETTGFHPEKEGGGVLVAVSNRFHSTRLSKSESHCEDLCSDRCSSRYKR